MNSTKIIEKMNKHFQDSEDLLPNVEEVEAFEDYLVELNHSIFGANQANSIIKTALDFEYSKFNYDILDCEQTDEKLMTYREKISKLINQISVLDSDYEKKLEEKEILSNEMKNYADDRDIILALKAGTLSHFCYDKKIKFGFLLKKKTLDCVTFPVNWDKEQELECRWSILKSFISK